MFNLQYRAAPSAPSKSTARNPGDEGKWCSGWRDTKLVRAVVVTTTLAVPLADGKDEGFTVHMDAAAGLEQDTLTCAEKLSRGDMDITFMYVAVCPATTVCCVLGEVVMLKSGPWTVRVVEFSVID